MPTVRPENLVLCNATLVGGSMEVSPEQLQGMLDASKGAGFEGVSLWAFHHLAVVGAGVAPEEVRAWHRDRSLAVPMIESLIGWESGDADAIDESCTPTFEVASFYGATTVAGVVMSPELESFDAAVAGLAHLAKRADERGMRVCVEWLPWSGLPDLASAWKLVQDTGCSNAGLVLDTWHWLRQPGGPDPDTLKSVPGERIFCVQLDDARSTAQGEDAMMESMTNRLLPGEGEVDFLSLFAILDEIGADPIWAPEVFNMELLAQGPAAMAKRIGDSTRDILGM